MSGILPMQSSQFRECAAGMAVFSRYLAVNDESMSVKSKRGCREQRPLPAVSSVFLPLIFTTKEEIAPVHQKKNIETSSGSLSRNGFNSNNVSSSSSAISSSNCTEKESSRVSFSIDLHDDESENENENSEEGLADVEGSLDSLDSLRIFLPMKRGLSRHYDGKSQSFSSLSQVQSLQDLAKPNHGRLAKKNRTS